jgi:ectoine hydroxylase-related dioxygenase (phytanoyl-CoA dioxygenase family)
MTLSQEQIDFFWANGYLKHGKLLTDDEIELYRTEYDRVFAEANRTNLYSNLASDNKSADSKRAAKTQMLQIVNMCERSVLFSKLNYDERILNFVEDLIGPNIMLFHDQALWKPARTGGAVFWHQDNAYWKCRPATLMSCWLTLDDATRENGAMQVIPGSHLKPVWHETGKTPGPLIESSVDTSKAQVIELPAGGVMFHHCQTLHYTQPNETDRQRRAYAIHFMQPGTRASDGNVIPVNYHHPMLRARWS